MKIRIISILLAMLCILPSPLMPPLLAAALEPADEGMEAGYILDEYFLYTYPFTDTEDAKPSGWDLDLSGGKIENRYRSSFKLVDERFDEEVSIKKDFLPQDKGIVTLEYRFRLSSNMNGAGLKLTGNDENIFWLYAKKGNLYYQELGEEILVQQCGINTYYGVKSVLDFDNATICLYINGALLLKNRSFASGASLIDNVAVNTGVDTIGEMHIAPILIHKGYEINELFTSVISGSLPEVWETVETSGTVSVEEKAFASNIEISSLKMEKIQFGKELSVTRKVNMQQSLVDFRYKFLLPQKTDGKKMSLLCGTTEVMSVATVNGFLAYAGSDGEYHFLQEYIGNLWYDIRMKLDIKAGKADIWINGKRAGVDLKVTGLSTGIDGVKFEMTAVGNTLWLDDIVLHKSAAQPEDYVPEPVKVDTGNHLVGMQSCSLWREGRHIGWDRINPYPERKPYLGYYDEGNPEVVDWEMKWMAENGIDFQFYLFYGIGKNNPIKDPPAIESSIHEGYFYAKYSDYVRFAIQYEDFTNSDDFRNNIVPFWMEYYFKDPRYMVVDNKPVVAFFNYSDLIRTLGSKEKAKEELNYLEKECRKAGFDGAIILTVYSGAATSELQNRKDIGMDGIYAYSWGGYAEPQKQKLTQQQKAGVIDLIPTFSMGRDNRAWQPLTASGRYTDLDEFEELLQWGKDVLMPNMPDGSLGKRMILLDNWNEYGEGHFMMPSELNGFGYIEAVRNVFGIGEKPKNFRPTETQLSRINKLYLQDRKVEKVEVQEAPVGEEFVIKWDFEDEGDLEGWTAVRQLKDAAVSGGTLTAFSTGDDPSMISPDNLGINAGSSPYVKIRMQNRSPEVKAEIFYTTNEEPNFHWERASAVSIVPNDSGYTEYVFPVWRKANWKGTIKQIRVDPLEQPGEFSVDYIGVLAKHPEDITLIVDSQILMTDRIPVVIEGTVMVPARALLEYLGARIDTWDGGTINVRKSGRSLSFSEGDSKAKLNGKTIDLERPPVLIDDKLLIPLSLVEEFSEVETHWDEEYNIINIITSSYSVGSNGALIWDFESELQGWTFNSQIRNVRLEDGIIKAVSTGNDPIIYSKDRLNIDLSDYSRIKVRLKNGTFGKSAAIYFTTLSSTGFDENKKGSLEIMARDKDFSVYSVNMSKNQSWNGTLKQLRFDPCETVGDFEIDYISLW